MPQARDLGERISSLEASVGAFREYESEKWHKLAQDLQPLVMLPERITRDVAKIQGSFDGKLGALEKMLDRSITAAIEKAILPMNQDIAELRSDVDALKLERQRFTGARRFGVWVVQMLIAATGAIIAVLAWGRHP
jgi:hypothetical protein